MSSELDIVICAVVDCGNEVNKHKGGARGMCSKHYKRWKRGTLDKPRYARERGAVGMNTVFPFEVAKIDGDWYRRPTGSDDDWQLVVWPEREKDLREPKYM